jgi:putative endonuclease
MNKKHCYYVYILVNVHHTVTYTGVTNDLSRRCHEHRSKVNKGFTAKYNITKLVYYESFQYILDAIAREKTIKKFSRVKKYKLIHRMNPEMCDLYDRIV